MGKELPKSKEIMGRGPGTAFSFCAFPQSPHPVWRQPQQFNLLHTLEMMWLQVIGLTLGCSTSSLGGGDLPESLLLTGERQPGPVRRYSTWRANSLQLGGSRYRMTSSSPRPHPAYILPLICPCERHAGGLVPWDLTFTKNCEMGMPGFQKG